MKRKIVSGLTLTLLVISMLTLAFNIQPVRSEPTTIIVPDDYPTIQEAINAASDGDSIFVRAGTYYEQIVVDKTVLLIGENKETTIVEGGNALFGVFNVMGGNIVIKEFTIRGNMGPLGAGIWGFPEFHGNTITIQNNIIVSNYLGIALHLNPSVNATIQNNILRNNHWGIQLDSGANNKISGNIVANNSYGISLRRSFNNMLHNNQMSENKYNFAVSGGELSHFIHDIDTSNVIDGKPIYYLINQKDIVADPATFPNVSFLAFVNSTNVTVRNLNLKGLLLADTGNSLITGNNIINSIYGIQLEGSSNNIIDGNDVTKNDGGISVRYSSNNRISGNNIKDNVQGIALGRSYGNNYVSGNNITDNMNGISLSFSNSDYISGNNITNNHIGINLNMAFYNVISGNNIINNEYGVYLFDSSNNTIHHNNLVNNAYQIYDMSWDLPWPLPSSINVWDNGYPSGGNYWSDYEEAYPDAEELDGSGIWDTPYVIDENNQDNYPLMRPWIPIPSVEIEITQPEAGDIFWIEAEPELKMPTIISEAKVIGIEPDPTAATKFTWEAECSYTGKVWTPVYKDGKYVDHTYVDYEFKHVFGPETHEGGTWNIDFGNIFCGGTLAIRVKAVVGEKEYQDAVTVYIKGKNPKPETIKSSLIDVDPEARVGNIFRQALCYRESKLRQFWDWPWPSTYPHYEPNMPVYGEPGGYGLMQIDWPVDSTWNKHIYKWGRASEEEVLKELREYQNKLMWDWQHNLREGQTKIKETVDATKKLQRQATVKFTQEQFEQNVASLYNSGKHYYYWNSEELKWKEVYPRHSGMDHADKVMKVKADVLAGKPPPGWYDP